MPGMQQSRSSHALPLPTQKVAGINSRSSSAGALNTGNAAVRKSSEPVAEVAKEESPAKKVEPVDDPNIDTLERRRRERAARRAAEQEKIRLEDERMQASIERRKKEREARRSSRKY